jgi:membrane protease YdiL (CAAX protease family)
VVLAPVIEELFFRAILIVTIFQMLRRSVGPVAAGATALLASGGMFVLLHGFSDALSVLTGLQLLAVGLTCGLIVLLTGRIWGAVLVHAIYNASYVLLVLAGTFLA